MGNVMVIILVMHAAIASGQADTAQAALEGALQSAMEPTDSQVTIAFGSR